jgi:pimeloyl-ACP methyl ester carboxylesterase
MGGFVAVSCAARYPEWIARVVLVDGGLRLGVEAPAASTVDDVLEAVPGPALERLRRTFTTAPPTIISGGSTRRSATPASGHQKSRPTSTTT